MFGRRSLFRRPRILGAALIGGLGFAAGRASRRTSEAASVPVVPAASPDLAAALKGLAEVHEAGSLTDDEYAAAKSKLLA
jgi:hypothetical protein